MSEVSAQISVKAILPARGEAAVWLAQYGNQEDRYGLPGGRLTDEDEGGLRAALQREIWEEVEATIVPETLAIAGAWVNLSDPRVSGNNRLVMVYAADLLTEPTGRLGHERHRGTKVPLAELYDIRLGPEYKDIIMSYMESQGWPMPPGQTPLPGPQ